MMCPASNSGWVRRSTRRALVQQAHCIGRSDGLAATARTAEFIGRRHECEQQRAADQERVPGGIFEQTFHQYDREKRAADYSSPADRLDLRGFRDPPGRYWAHLAKNNRYFMANEPSPRLLQHVSATKPRRTYRAGWLSGLLILMVIGSPRCCGGRQAADTGAKGSRARS